MGKLLRALIVLMVLVAGLAFHARNHAPLMLDFYAVQTEVPASWLGVGALALGAVLGMLAMLPGRWRLARELRRRTRELALVRAQQPPAEIESLPGPIPPPAA